MKSVLIVGAGGSLAQAASFRPKQDRFHPPLDKTFFEKVNRLSAVANVAAAQSELSRLLSKASGFADPFAPGGISLEQFFADVYYEVAREREPQDYNVFLALLRLYAALLAVTTNWMARRSGKPGALGELLLREVRETTPDRPTVITFNQDLVIENTVARFPAALGSWCLASLYADATLSPLSAIRRSADLFRQHVTPCPGHNPPLTLLKLHGSLNWGVVTLNRDPPITSLFPADRNKKIWVIDEPRPDPLHQTYNTGKSRGRKKWYLQPLLVPPIYDKTQVTGMNVLGDLWAKAHAAIGSAERITLVGYSIPPADVHARQALRRAFQSNSALRRVVCIDPDPAIVAKLTASLDCGSVDWYASIDEYLATTN